MSMKVLLYWCPFLWTSHSPQDWLVTVKAERYRSLVRVWKVIDQQNSHAMPPVWSSLVLSILWPTIHIAFAWQPALKTRFHLLALDSTFPPSPAALDYHVLWHFYPPPRHSKSHTELFTATSIQHTHTFFSHSEGVLFKILSVGVEWRRSALAGSSLL